MPATMGAVQAGLGLAQGAFGYFQNRKALKQLENLRSPTYTPNKGISDYYGEALSRYSQNAYNSAMYKNLQEQNQRSTAQGVADLQSRRAAVMGLPTLIRNQNDANLKAAGAAEQVNAQNFGVLGRAAGMQAAEQGKAFQINQMMPYERRYQMLASKAAGGANIMNAGLSNISGGVQGAGYGSLMKQIYGVGGGKSVGGNGAGIGNSNSDGLYTNQINLDKYRLPFQMAAGFIPKGTIYGGG